MGTRGLTDYLRRHYTTRTSAVSLGRAAFRGQKVLVCDFISVILWLVEAFHECMVRSKEYAPHSYIYGGDIHDYVTRVLQFVDALRFVGLDPQFFVDGPRGSNREQLSVKRATWLYRHRKRSHTSKHNASYSKSMSVFDNTLCKDIGVRSFLLKEIVQALQDYDVKIVSCDGEADLPMASYARSNPNVCGILTTDSDLTMMSGCSTILCKFFDRDDALNLRRPTLNVKPSDILCEKIDPDRLAKCLDIDVACLPALSILCGNDYTGHYIARESVQQQLKMTRPYVTWAAEWIRSRKSACRTAELFLRDAKIKLLLDTLPSGFKKAVNFSYRFYNAAVDPLIVPIFDDKRSFTARMSFEFQPIINSGVYWCSPLDVADDDGNEDIYKRLEPVRTEIYHILEVERKCITEFRPGCSSPQRIAMDRGEETTSRTESATEPTDCQRMLLLYNTLTRDQANIAAASLSLLGQCNIPAIFTYSCLVAARRLCIVDPEHLTTLTLTCLCSSVAMRSTKCCIRPDYAALSTACQFECIIEHSFLLAALHGLETGALVPSMVFNKPMYIAFHMMTVSGKKDKALHERYTKLVRFLPEIKALNDDVEKGASTGIASFVVLYYSCQEKLKDLK